jgi:hypothetical protein
LSKDAFVSLFFASLPRLFLPQHALTRKIASFQSQSIFLAWHAPRIDYYFVIYPMNGMHSGEKRWVRQKRTCRTTIPSSQMTTKKLVFSSKRSECSDVHGRAKNVER